MFLTKIET